MSLIRWSTRLGKKESKTYAWQGRDGFHIWGPTDPDTKGVPGSCVRMTRAEFRYMVEQAVKQYGWAKP